MSSAQFGIQIPGYTISKYIGSGASGQVFLAHKGSQQIAIKIFQLNDSQSFQQRFEREAHVLKQLDHNGIPAFIDSGITVQGQFYLAMEFIDGVSIDNYVSEQHLNPQQITRLITQCSDIMAFAHQKGILHRDLKPANILVTPDAKVYILDFGIAGLLDVGSETLTRLTMEGQLLGTLPYMSPEQLNGELEKLTPASDIYSLGVIAYELIAQHHPFTIYNLGLSEAISAILDARVPPLSQLNKEVSIEITHIVQQCMHRDPGKRYSDCWALSEDLRRWLNGDKIHAQGINTWEEIRNLVHRHKLPVFAASSIFVISVLAASISSWFAWQEKIAREQTEVQMQRAQAVTDFFVSTIASADPEQSQGKDLTVKELVLNAATLLDSHTKSPQLEASIRCTLGDSLRSLEHFDQAKTLIKEGLELAEKNSETSKQCLLSLGILQSKMGDRTAARETFSTINAPENSQIWISYQTEIALMDTLEGDFEAALSHLQNLLSLPFSVLPEHAEQRLVALHDHASVLREMGKLEQAEKEMRRVIAIRTQVYGEDHSQTLYSLNNLGAILIQQNKLEQAEQLYQKVIRIRSRVYGAESEQTLGSKTNLLNIYVQQNKLKKADELSQQLLNSYEKKFKGSEKHLQLMAMRAYVLEDLGKINAAEALYRHSLSLINELDGANIVELLPARNNLAMLLMNNGRLKEAKSEFEKLLSEVEAQIGKKHPYYALFQNNYGECLMMLKLYSKASKELKESHQNILSIFGAKHPRTLKSQYRLEQLNSATIRADKPAL